MRKLLQKIRLKILILSAKASGFKAVGSHHIYPGNINTDSIVIDIGGNKGDFYNLMFANFNPYYYFIEADPGLIGQIKPHPKLSISNLAISRLSGNMSFYLSLNSEANSFSESMAKMYGIKEIIKVKSLTLDKFCAQNNIEAIQLLKVDVEGAEIEIFESLSDQFLKNIDQITIEFHEVYDSSLMKPTISCINRLRNNGFIPIVFGSDSFEDVVFLNTKIIKMKFLQKFWLSIHTFFQYRPLNSAYKNRGNMNKL